MVPFFANTGTTFQVYLRIYKHTAVQHLLRYSDIGYSDFMGTTTLKKSFVRFLIGPTGQRTTEAVDPSTIAANECRGLSFALFFSVWN